jgi:hypothetical protein
LQLSKLVPSAVLKKPKYASEKSITHDREWLKLNETKSSSSDYQSNIQYKDSGPISKFSSWKEN